MDIKMYFRIPAKIVVISAIFLCFVFTSAASDPVWNYKGAKWYQLLESGNVVVGTKKGLEMLHGPTGERMWRRSDLRSVDEVEVFQLEGTPLLLVADNTGSRKRRTRLTAVDTLSGDTVWRTDKIKGFTALVAPFYERDLLIFLTIRDNHRNRDRPEIYAHRLSTGEQLWDNEYPDTVELYRVGEGPRHGYESFRKGDEDKERYDLSGENPPVFEGDSMFLTYAGLHRYDLNTGRLVCKNEYDITDGSLKNTNSQAIARGEIVYTSAKGIVRAIRKSDCSTRWKSDDYGDGGIPEMMVHGNVIYGRTGGQFFSIKRNEWKIRGPVGVVALDAGTGESVWRYTKAKDSITNMVLDTAKNRLFVADKKYLIGLDLDARGKTKEALRFKHKLDRVPVSLVAQRNGNIVVRAIQDLVSFNPSTGKIGWALEFDAPGVSGWRKFAMSALAITAGVVTYKLQAAYVREGHFNSVWRTNKRFLNFFSKYQRLMRKRFATSRQVGNIFYILTTVKSGKKKGTGVVGVDMLRGRTAAQVLFKDKTPRYQVDEFDGRLFNLNKGKISAYMIEPYQSRK